MADFAVVDKTFSSTKESNRAKVVQKTTMQDSHKQMHF